LRILRFLAALAGLESARPFQAGCLFFTGARIAANPRFARFTLKTPKRRSSIRCSATERVFQRFKNSFDGLLGLRAADIRGCYDSILRGSSLIHVRLQGLGRC